MSVLTIGGRRSVRLSRSASSGWPSPADDVVVVVDTGVNGVASIEVASGKIHSGLILN